MSLDQLQGDTTQNAPMFLERRLDRPLGIGNLAGLQPGPGLGSIEGGIIGQLPVPPRRFPPFMPGPIMPQPPMLKPVMPDYSSQFEKLGETLGGFGEQLGGFGKQIDALGSFNEQVGGLGKQFESVNNKLDSLEKGLGSLGNQLASIEQGQPKPQEVQQPQQPSYSPFGFGGLANLFMNMRRF